MTTRFPGDSNDHRHLFLAAGNSAAQARRQAVHFMETTQLVVYQSTSIREEEIRSGHWPHFWQELEAGIAANRAFSSALVDELAETNLIEIKDLLTLHPGYPSKVLHILTHMIDGFFGIDSVFYNLVTDSHRLTDSLRAAIEQDPEGYWLVPVWHGPVTSSLLSLGK
ncbi:MAG: hypothetical protein K0A99_03335 [Desulfoarculaceae bacterium]|nr:hypothetical protein [Desulfoarculaceae bacterium]